MLATLNQSLFTLINAPVSASETTVLIANLAAKWLIVIVALSMLLGWVRGSTQTRRALFSAGLAAIIGLALNGVVHALWPYPRPFAAGYGQQFLNHAADASFPSDHGTILFSIAVALLFHKNRFAVAALVAALATAWARIYVGVHWPLDMMGAFAVALIAAPLASTLLPKPTTILFSLSLRAYHWLHSILHLPASLFPR